MWPSPRVKLPDFTHFPFGLIIRLFSSPTPSKQIISACASSRMTDSPVYTLNHRHCHNPQPPTPLQLIGIRSGPSSTHAYAALALLSCLPSNPTSLGPLHQIFSIFNATVVSQACHHSHHVLFKRKKRPRLTSCTSLLTLARRIQVARRRTALRRWPVHHGITFREDAFQQCQLHYRRRGKNKYSGHP